VVGILVVFLVGFWWGALAKNTDFRHKARNSAEYFVPQSQLSYARNVLQLRHYLTTISRPLFVG
jgi:uncharacterized membrane protein YsdA (DUF1294 family)